MKVVILAGGLGTRLQEETALRPKPMVEIGGFPIIWHIMNIYAAYGYKEFILALGYKGEVVKNYFVNYQYLNNNISVNLKDGEVTIHRQKSEDWLVHMVDTGARTETGGRLKRLTNLIGDETFMMTYGDGVADIDIPSLIAYHRSNGKLVTLTAVRPPARFGSLNFEGDLVSRFAEKPQVGEGWINGGFFVIEPHALDYIAGDFTPWETHPLEQIAQEGQLIAFRHEGFWQCMDTQRDMRMLDALWAERKSALDDLEMNPAFWLKRRVLVTGSTGLLGSWLVKRLVEAGADVICLIRNPEGQSELFHSKTAERVQILHGDIRDQALLERGLEDRGVQTVFHLAAQAIVSLANRNPVPTFETNIQGTWALLEACRKNGKVAQLVVASSDKAYGDQDTLPYFETTPLQGRHPYEASKACADLLAQTYAVTYAMPVAITRCGNFFGGGDLNWNRIIPGTIRSVLSGERPVIRSDGNFVRDYFYIEDAAAVNMLLAEKLADQPELRGEAFNFSYESSSTVVDIVKKILELMHSDLKPEIRNEVSNEIRKQLLSAEKARRLLGWQPQFDMQTGLARTIAWYRDYLNA